MAVSSQSPVPTSLPCLLSFYTMVFPGLSVVSILTSLWLRISTQLAKCQPCPHANFIHNLWIWGLPQWLSGKESACNAGNAGSNPGLGRSPGGRKGYPLQYSGLKNSRDCIVHGVAKSWTRLRDFHFHSLIICLFHCVPTAKAISYILTSSLPPAWQKSMLS